MRVRVEGLWTKGQTEATGPVVLTVRSGLIESIGPDEGPVDVRVDGFALPGLVDCHEHIGLNVGDERTQSLDDALRMAIRGVEALRAMLDAGITTIRDCGERVDVEPYWIEALEQGVIAGPRVIRSVTPICRTGGHAWYLSAQADGVEQARAAVRRNIRDGADFIKVMASGGIGTVGSVADSPEFTDAELYAIVDEAHRLGRKVAAHGHGGAGVDQALTAGVDSIEHGVLLTTEQIARMADLGTYLVVTMGIAAAFATDESMPPSVREKSASTLPGYRKVLQETRSAGVSLALGSDCVHGGLAAEARYLVEAGYTPVEALVAATSNGAELIGLDGIGKLKEGYMADVLFVAGDPTRDIGELDRVIGVLQAGKWARKPVSEPLVVSA